MTHDEVRKRHSDHLRNYLHSAEYAEYVKESAADIPQGPLPSLLGKRWEIDEKTYMEFLEVLPPLAYHNGSFYLSEFTFGDITTKYTKEGDRYYCEFARYQPKRQHPIETPWGFPDTLKEIAPGIVLYSTPSHGGYWLSPARVAAMPKPLRDFQPFTGANWYEEDADWSIVALAFPKLFPEDAIPAALETIKHYKPELYEQIMAAGIGQGRKL